MDQGAGPGKEKAEKSLQLPTVLKFQYAYGTDTEIIYVKNPNLNTDVPDDFILAAPNIFGIITYRPTGWSEMTLEMTLERQIAIKEEPVATLPDGSIQYAEKKRWSLFVDQAYLMFKDLGPFDVTAGRRNFEDALRWLYDVPLDGLIVNNKLGNFYTEASVTRENWVVGELFYAEPRGKINNYILYTTYRGIEDHKLGAYIIKQDDTKDLEGDPLFLGVRAYGRPTDKFNYRSQIALTRGRDDENLDLKGWAFDVLGTYRFPSIRLQPGITLGYAFGSGDSNPDDNINNEFWQTGLQSNEGIFGGVTQFKYYGEMLDPDLTNLNIYTAGVSFRLAINAFVDLVYHHYRLDEFAEELRNSGVTALMNQDETKLSKEVGSEIDIILGFRSIFGVRKLGLDIRAGWFRPGKAFQVPMGDPEEPTYRKADDAFSVRAVLIY